MNWLEQDQYYRPLRLAHRLLSDPNQPEDEAILQVREKLAEIQNLGYGGIVTNVSLTEYLENEHFWKMFKKTMEICHEMGMRVWLYDEKGYPSGGAGGKVVRDHPEYEAYGIVCLKYPVHKTAHLAVPLPNGHDKVIAAFAVEEGKNPGDAGACFSLLEYVDENGLLCWDSDRNGTVYYIAGKPLFEGVHAARNYHQIRRYVNVLDPDAMKYFLDITYEKYKKHVGQYFGNLIEAIFTDEPSIMGRYCRRLDVAGMNEQPQTEPREDIPLYPHVVWAKNFPEEFSARKGYDIIPFIPLLFEGDSAKARQVRHDYHEVAAQLYEEAYFKQIEAFCSENGLLFTGHLLGEENLHGQITDEYDYFQMMQHMHAPGIDLLTADPKRILQVPLLPKIASSVARQYGRKTVMSESSDFTERHNGETVTWQRVFASFAAQYACGITQITSYFADDKFPPETYRLLNRSVSRMGQLLEGGAPVVPLLLYYPARSFWQYDLPTDQIDVYRDFHPLFWYGHESFQQAMQGFGAFHLDYDLIDRTGLERLKVVNHRLLAQGGGQYQAIYVSAVDFARDEILNVLTALCQAGAKVFIEKSKTADTSVVSQLQKAGAVVVDGPSAVFNSCSLGDIVLSGAGAAEVRCLYKRYDTEDRVMLVNTVDQPLTVNVLLKGDKQVRCCDVVTDQTKECRTQKTNSNTTVEIILSGYQVLFLFVENRASSRGQNKYKKGNE